MGYLKELWTQMQEDKLGVQIADILGITYMDLDMLKYELRTNESDEGLIYSYDIEFSKECPKEILQKIKRLNGFKVTLNPSELDTSEDDYYEEQYEAITSNKDLYLTFCESIENLRKLVNLEIEDKSLEEILYRQIFISIFGTLETFLSDTFINFTMDNDDYLQNFVESHPEFKKRKFELCEIFQSYGSIRETAKKVMIDTIYHDLPKIKEMYASTFKIDFPELKDIIKLVSIRHDLVHRNGKTKEGEKVVVDREMIEKVFKLISEFVKDISDKLRLKTCVEIDF